MIAFASPLAPLIPAPAGIQDLSAEPAILALGPRFRGEERETDLFRRRRAIGPQSLQRDFAETFAQRLHVGGQAGEACRTLVTALVHIERAIALGVERVAGG